MEMRRIASDIQRQKLNMSNKSSSRKTRFVKEISVQRVFKEVEARWELISWLRDLRQRKVTLIICRGFPFSEEMRIDASPTKNCIYFCLNSHAT